MPYKIFEYDPGLVPYREDILQRMKNYENKRRELLPRGSAKNISAMQNHMIKHLLEIKQ